MTSDKAAVKPVAVDATVAAHVADEKYGNRYDIDWRWHHDRIGYLYGDATIAKLQADHAAALQAARDEVERLRSELQFIAEIDPRESSNGFNEWGEAECFRVAQERAKHALAPAKKVD